MFEATAKSWQRYTALAGSGWAEDDQRHSLATEVAQRLRHLDRIMAHLQQAIDDFIPDREASQKAMQWGLANHARFESGELGLDEWIKGTEGPRPRSANILGTSDDLWIFTESFYFSAWRLVGIVNRRTPAEFALPALSKVEARAITIVRNNLIEHPEHRGSQNFTMGLTVTDNGPVLRTTEMVVRFATGRSDPPEESKDQGLFLAAEQLRIDLDRSIDAAIKQLTLPSNAT